MPLYFSLLALVLVVSAAVTDLRWHKIPNILTFPSMGLGLVGHGIAYGWDGIVLSLGGWALGLLLLLGFYAMGGMAAGDVKLLAAVGSILGPENVFQVFLIATLLGGLYALGGMIQESGLQGMFRRVWAMLTTLLLTGKVKGTLPDLQQSQMKLRYGLVIALGTIAIQLPNWTGVI